MSIIKLFNGIKCYDEWLVFLGTVYYSRYTPASSHLQLDGRRLGLLLAVLEALLGLSRSHVALASVTLVDQELGVHLGEEEEKVVLISLEGIRKSESEWNTYAQGGLVPLDLWSLDSVAVSLAVLVVIRVIL